MTANLLAATTLTPGVQFSGQLASTAETTVFTCPALSSIKIQSWILANVGLLPVPIVSSTSTATTGGSLVAASYSYRVTAANALGQTGPSVEVTQVVPAGTATNTVTTNWSAVPGATGYSIYGRTLGTEQLIATLGNVLTYTDLGSITPAGAIPNANTTSVTVTVNASVLQSGQSTGTSAHRIVSGYLLAPGDAMDVCGLVGAPMLGPGDFLTVTAATANVVNVVITGAVGT